MMSIDHGAIHSAASNAAYQIECYCCGGGGGVQPRPFDRGRAIQIIENEFDSVVRDAMKRAERRTEKRHNG